MFFNPKLRIPMGFDRQERNPESGHLTRDDELMYYGSEQENAIGDMWAPHDESRSLRKADIDRAAAATWHWENLATTTTTSALTFNSVASALSMYSTTDVATTTAAWLEAFSSGRTNR